MRTVKRKTQLRKAIIGYQEVTREMEFNMSFSHLTEYSIVEEFLTDF